MKIGIITFWESTDNYGQVLQAYALQQVLKNMGHNPFQIRYSLRASQLEEKKTSVFKRLLKVLLVYPFVKSIKRRKVQCEDAECKKILEKKNVARKFREFRNQYITQSEKVYNSINELRSDPPQADCYITGSDQVWTMLLSNEGNAAYYLDFGNKSIKRIAYAASFGRSEYPDFLLPRLKTLLARFDSISVREQEGVVICNSIGLNVEHVLDPTLLLSKNEYLDKLKCFVENDVKEKTLFVYSINVRTSEDIYWKELNKYAADNKLKIIVTTSSGNIPGRELYEGVEYSYATIEEWLKLVNYAHLVVTTSFHGVVFCLLTQTNFVFVPLHNSGSRGNGRLESLLGTLGLTSKICYSSDSFEIVANTDIDWEKVSHSLEIQRLHSLFYLRSVIDESN